MTTFHIAASIVSALLLGYLFVALLTPERF